MGRRTLLWLTGLVLATGCGLALAQEGDGPQAGGRRPRRGPEGGPGLGRPGGQRAPRGPMGVDIPAIREEMKRHTEELRGIMADLRPQGEGIREKIRELREKGASREEIRAALKPDPAKAHAVAGKIADAFATHHENMARIFHEHRAAVAKSILENLGKRVPGRDGPRRPNGGPGERRRPRPQRDQEPGGAKEAAPENF